jgi:hypothetical protein
MEKTTTDNGYRSACCYAPIRLGRKKIKNTSLTTKIWICVKCQKRDVNIIEYSKVNTPASTRFLVDTEDEAPLELNDEMPE